MRFAFTLVLYRLLLPVLFVAAFPGWVVKMIRRGGFGTRLGERLAIFSAPADFEPCGATHVHAISVGETLLALKLIREWLAGEPDHKFVIAVGTSTGHAVATGANLLNVRVTYSPLDFPSAVRRYLNRFEPSRIVLIEGEAWPHLLLACRARKIPVHLVNARLSPRSARRYRKFAKWVRPLFGLLDGVAIQDAVDEPVWRELGIASEKIHLAGSLKFDPGSGAPPSRRPEFQAMLDACGTARPVVLASSTHAGEEAWIASAIREAAPHALPVIVPRHAERRAEVKADLAAAGFEVALRSTFTPPATTASCCLVVDSTGELRDWTAHADAVIIGKTFLTIGGQSPAEAILARKPLIFGPHMENFEPLASRLVSSGGALRAEGHATLVEAVRMVLDPEVAADLTRAAAGLLDQHEGATARLVAMLRP